MPAITISRVSTEDQKIQGNSKLDEIREDEIESICFKNVKNYQEWWFNLKDLYQKTNDYLDSNFWKKDPIYKSDKNFKSKLWEMIMINYFLDK